MSIQVKTYLKYIAIALFIIIPFASFQFFVVYGLELESFDKRLIAVPVVVSTIFGLLMGHAVLLRSQLKEAQKQLIQEAKMASLSHLVKSVAHEINTPTGNSITLLGTLQENKRVLEAELQNRVPQKDLVDSTLENMDQALKVMTSSLKQISDLVQNFKTISTDQCDELKEVDLNRYIQSLLKTYQLQLEKQGIKLNFNSHYAITATTYPSLLLQILTQCINNAVNHAFDKISSPMITVNLSANKQEAIIEVEDNGRGINPKILPTIFDPFTMSTRKSHHVGLGLSMVYNIVTENLKGSIEAINKEKHGALFVIKIPLSLKS